ncbi:LexA family protein [Vibrio barjaei]|uniref:LexA family protein n=1 Tax=Vibrio barjaei TaxID=1676683 RepID=UPI0022843E8F|nr:S24 family peptidase [Vibrio barjaei]MCY9873865.1 S24 family peptidase [Vibrio barjaei]
MKSLIVHCSLSQFDSPAKEYSEFGISLDKHLIKNKSATFIARASGNCMANAGIADGDILIIDRSAPRQKHSIYICALNGEFVCKYLDTDNRLLFTADENEPPYHIKEEDDFTIEGIVTSCIKEFQ